MNKIYTIALLLLLSACSLDQHDPTRLDTEQITTKQELSGVRGGAYSMARYLYTGTNAFYTDYATDLFSVLVNAGSRGVFFSTFTLDASDADVRAIWDDSYRTISRINLYFDSLDQVTDVDEEVEVWSGELYLLRAMLYRLLAVRFCADYDPTTAATTYGVPLVTTYDVTNPGGARGSLADTYEQILSDMNQARTRLTTPGRSGSTSLTADCVTAFEAQVALDMHNYTGAIDAADKIIGSSTYRLSATAEELARLWGDDYSTEIIGMFAMESSDLNPEEEYTPALIDNTDLSFVDLTSGARRVSVAPCGWLAQCYADQAGVDWRVGSYVQQGEIVGAAQVAAQGYYLTKFDGAQDLQQAQGVNSYHSRPKPFTLADVYLIKAEAEYRQNGGGAATLSAFREKRGYGAGSVTQTGEELFEAIRRECAMEFVGEGRRLADLKRWGVPFTRDAQQEPGFEQLLTSHSAVIDGAPQPTQSVTVPANYWGLTLPIPSREFSVNPALAGAQNTGY